MKRVAQIHLTIIGLSVVAGLAHKALYSLQHIVTSGWAELASYLAVIPLASAVAFMPGLAAGFWFGTERLGAAAVAGVLAYLPFQFAVMGKFTFDLPTASAYAVAFAIATVIAVLAGAQVAQLRHASNHSFKADAAP